MKSVVNVIYCCILGVVLSACGGASATPVPPTAVLPTIPPTAVVPTPDISAYSQMDLSGGDAGQGLNVAIAFECKACHDATRTEKGPRFAAADDLPPILERGELRVADPAYKGRAVTDLDYVLESIFIPEAYTAPGEWVAAMPVDYAARIDDEELVHLLAWLATFE